VNTNLSVTGDNEGEPEGNSQPPASDDVNNAWTFPSTRPTSSRRDA